MQFKLVNSVLICVMMASSVLAKSNLKSAINQFKKEKAALRADDDEPVVFETTVDEKFYYYNYFLKGFKSDEKMPSSMNCSEYLQLTLNDYNETTSYWGTNETTGGKHQAVFNVTDWISNSFAHSQRYCFLTSMEAYMWYQFKSSLFDGFNSWFPAFLQNLLGQVMTFKQVEEKIEEAILEENLEAQWYWYGRLGYMLLDFDPIEVDDTDIEDDDVPFLMEIYQQLNKKTALKSAAPVVESPVVQGLGGNYYDFLYHAMNSSMGTSSPNSTICEDSTQSVHMYWDHFYASMKAGHYNSSSLNLEYTLEQVHPISTSCYYSVGEFKEIGNQYVNGANSDQLTYNLVHRLGYISDTITLIKETPNETEEDQEYYYKQLGNYWGHIIKLIFYSPEDYDPYDPAHDMNPNDQTISRTEDLPHN